MDTINYDFRPKHYTFFFIYRTFPIQKSFPSKKTKSKCLSTKYFGDTFHFGREASQTGIESTKSANTFDTPSGDSSKTLQTVWKMSTSSTFPSESSRLFAIIIRKCENVSTKRSTGKTVCRKSLSSNTILTRAPNFSTLFQGIFWCLNLSSLIHLVPIFSLSFVSQMRELIISEERYPLIFELGS